MSSLLLDAVHIIDIVSPSEEIENRSAPNAVDLRQITVIADLLDDLSLTQHMAVMHLIFQTVNVCLNFYFLPSKINKCGRNAAGAASQITFREPQRFSKIDFYITYLQLPVSENFSDLPLPRRLPGSYSQLHQSTTNCPL